MSISDDIIYLVEFPLICFPIWYLFLFVYFFKSLLIIENLKSTEKLKERGKIVHNTTVQITNEKDCIAFLHPDVASLVSWISLFFVKRFPLIFFFSKGCTFGLKRKFIYRHHNFLCTKTFFL